MMQVQNPIRIDIRGSDAGHNASEWCQKHIAPDAWDMWIGNRWTHYIFEFANKKDATIFALRWAEHA
jgi:hypothetical protein